MRGTQVSDEMVTISGMITAATEGAILFNDGDTCAWLPKSQVEGLDPPILEDEEVDLEIPSWLADREGF